jgi:putative N6-adenine-specific DNA methylase
MALAPLKIIGYCSTVNLNEQGTFFIQVAPGFEQIALEEIKSKYPHLSSIFSQVAGGLEGKVLIEVGFSLNQYLKIPNRILLRIDEFKCRDLPKLYNKVKKMDLRFFNYGQEFTFHISANKSRLFDDRKIKQTLIDGLKANYQAYPPKKKVAKMLQQEKSWNLFCRFQNDNCTLSLDTSGERLGKRGYKKSSGLAPLRENLAAGLWFFMTFDMDLRNKKILDPFAGSGTFLLEAQLFNKKVTTRRFAYQALSEVTCNQEINKEVSLELSGIELNDDQYECLHKNLSDQDIKATLFHKNNLEVNEEHVSQVDIIISNPPYDKRVHGSSDFWKRDITAERLGILMPPGRHPRFEDHSLLRELAFSHGGQDVIFKVFKKN